MVYAEPYRPTSFLWGNGRNAGLFLTQTILHVSVMILMAAGAGWLGGVVLAEGTAVGSATISADDARRRPIVA